MEPYSLDTLFKEFTYMEFNNTTAQWRGLSLVLARQIVLAHKGSLTIESEKGSGTMVTISLPKATENIDADELTSETTILMDETALI